MISGLTETWVYNTNSELPTSIYVNHGLVSSKTGIVKGILYAINFNSSTSTILSRIPLWRYSTPMRDTKYVSQKVVSKR